MAKIITPTDEHRTALQWCIKNNIKIGVKPTKRGLKVEINDNNKITISPSYYSNIEAQNKCWELYLYIYKKYWNK
jgi:hypothetical protein